MSLTNPANWKFHFIKLNLKETWSISRNSSQHKDNLFIELQFNKNKYLGEAAPNVRYGENKEKLEKEIEEFKSLLSGLDKNHSATEAAEKLFDHVKTFSNAFQFAITTVLHQVLAECEGKSFFEYLKIKPAKDVPTSFSIPILSSEKEILTYIDKYNVEDFQSVKIKIKNHEDLNKVAIVAQNVTGKLRIDANEGLQSIQEWKQFIDGLQRFNQQIEFIEQPFPEDRVELYRQAKVDCPYPIILDESIKNQKIQDDIVELCHGINVKLMKSADLKFAISQLQSAKKLGLKTMIGCMIESSIGIFFAMHLASLCDYHDLDGHLLISNDPFDRINLKNGLLNFSQ